jgi:hypothetical protein
MSGRVNYTMPQKQFDDLKSLVDQIEGELEFAVDLNDEERASLPKTGDKRLAFVRTAASVVDMDSDFLPRSFNIPEFVQDVALMNQLVDINLRLERVAQRVNDTLLEVGSEAYVAALVVYKNAKDNGRGEELDKVVDAMGKSFIKKSRLDPQPA